MNLSTKLTRKASLLLIPIILLLIISVVNIRPAFAELGGGNTGISGSESFSLRNPLKVNSIGELVQNFVEIFSYIVILFAVLLLVWVGLRFIMVRGNFEEIKKLKDWLLWIVVGVAVVIGARLIIQIVINTLASTGTVDQRTIQSVQKAVNGK